MYLSAEFGFFFFREYDKRDYLSNFCKKTTSPFIFRSNRDHVSMVYRFMRKQKGRLAVKIFQSELASLL